LNLWPSGSWAGVQPTELCPHHPYIIPYWIIVILNYIELLKEQNLKYLNKIINFIIQNIQLRHSQTWEDTSKQWSDVNLKADNIFDSKNNKHRIGFNCLTNRFPFLRGIYMDKISTDICAKNCASKTVYHTTINKFHIKMLELARFLMSARILPL
jgi:hypothetical protein